MTLSDDLITDLERVLYNSDEFDTSATLTITGPVVSTVLVSFHKKVTAVDPFTGDVDVDIGQPHALGIATDFSLSKQGDTLLIDGNTYKINRIVDDGIGQALIWLYT